MSVHFGASRTVGAVAASVAVWTAGDLAAQWAQFRRTHRLDTKSVDHSRLQLTALFGAATAPFLVVYRNVVIPRIFGPLKGHASSCLAALAAHQLVVSPGLLLMYFNAMTAARGGFANPQFLYERQSGATKRLTVLSVERYMFDEVLPFPLLCSWALSSMLYLAAYAPPYQSAVKFSLLGTIALMSTAWTSVASYTQTSLLL